MFKMRGCIRSCYLDSAKDCHEKDLNGQLKVRSAGKDEPRNKANILKNYYGPAFCALALVDRDSRMLSRQVKRACQNHGRESRSTSKTNSFKGVGYSSLSLKLCCSFSSSSSNQATVSSWLEVSKITSPHKPNIRRSRIEILDATIQHSYFWNLDTPLLKHQHNGDETAFKLSNLKRVHLWDKFFLVFGCRLEILMTILHKKRTFRNHF